MRVCTRLDYLCSVFHLQPMTLLSNNDNPEFTNEKMKL